MKSLKAAAVMWYVLIDIKSRFFFICKYQSVSRHHYDIITTVFTHWAKQTSTSKLIFMYIKLEEWRFKWFRFDQTYKWQKNSFNSIRTKDKKRRNKELQKHFLFLVRKTGWLTVFPRNIQLSYLLWICFSIFKTKLKEELKFPTRWFCTIKKKKISVFIYFHKYFVSGQKILSLNCEWRLVHWTEHGQKI